MLKNRSKMIQGFGMRPEPPVMRLFCFHYAGGGASAFWGWRSFLPEQVEICPVQLPGRENRISEKPYSRLDPLVEALIDEFRDHQDLPFAFFGHSMGACIAFELARRMGDGSKSSPEIVFVSGRRTPHWPDDEPLSYNLPEEEFIEKVKEMGGTHDEVLSSPELMEMLLPILRNDFELLETFDQKVGPPLSCPIIAYGGLEDPRVPQQAIEEWRDHTESGFDYRMFPGGHFFIRDSREAFLDDLDCRLRRELNRLK